MVDGAGPPPARDEGKLEYIVGGAVRMPRQAEGVYGKLPAHSSAPGASLLDIGLSQSARPQDIRENRDIRLT